MNSETESETRPTAFWLTLASGICFVLSFYPVGWGWLGWLAPIGVLNLVIKTKLPGKRPLLQIWFACFFCWLALFQCVRLPHWAGYIGWPILSAFLGSYLFLFVFVGRCLVHRLRIPILLAAPVTWTGVEYIQAHFCTGISLGMLSHTQAQYPLLIQIADLGGCYTVSFFMLAVVTGVWVACRHFFVRQAIENRDGKWNQFVGWAGVLQAIVCLSFVIGYGWWRLEDANVKMVEHPQRIALIQGSIDTRFPDESEWRDYLESFNRQYTELSVQAADQQVDMVIWPETMFPAVDVFAPSEKQLNDSELEEIRKYSYQLAVTAHLVTGTGRIETTKTGQKFVQEKPAVPILAGASSTPVGGERVFYNSAILTNDQGRVVSRYGKMKLVLFGEFVPLGDSFPWLYQFFPIPAGLSAGEEPVAMSWASIKFSPSICFESTYPHLLRDQYIQLTERGKKPDVLVNLTNDGWFYGSTALDLHFANSVFRAVENRTPMLIAANTGFSGQIDSAGRVLAKGARRKAELILVNLITSKQLSPYHRVGDWPAFSCFILVFIGILTCLRSRFLKGNYN